MSDKRIALIGTEYRENSHVDVIAARWLEEIPEDVGYGWPPPNGRQSTLASVYLDQFPDNDLGRQRLGDAGVPLHDTVDAALTDGDKLAIDGVLLVGEHGDYPYNDLGQKLYPRERLLNDILAAFDRVGGVAPVFCDKHLSYDFEIAQRMVRACEGSDVPLLAASSLPLCPTTPNLRDRLDGADLREIVAAYPQVNGGQIESYGYHSLEVAQHFLERRIGGEAGAAAVTRVEEDRVPADQLAAALDGVPLEPPQHPRKCFLIEHRDGVRQWQVAIDGNRHFATSFRLADGTVLACRDDESVPSGRYSNFGALMRLVTDWMFRDIRPWPTERDLLTCGLLQAMCQAEHADGESIETPHLDLPYQPSPHRVGVDVWADTRRNA
jgi:hypothetical protein